MQERSFGSRSRQVSGPTSVEDFKVALTAPRNPIPLMVLPANEQNMDSHVVVLTSRHLFQLQLKLLFYL